MNRSLRYVVVGSVAAVLLAMSAAAAATGQNQPAEHIATQYLARFGEGYRAQVDPQRRLIFITALDEEHFKQTAAMLAVYADIQRKSLFSGRLPWDVALVLPTIEDYATLGRAKNVSGFYNPAHRALVSVDRGRVLIHEFTHALHHADQASADQQHPIWIAEGLATLFECSEIRTEAVIPQVDQRLVVLQRAIEAKVTIPLADLLKLDQEAFARQWELAYAQSRYVMLYLYQQNKLSRWYETYKSLYRVDTSGRQALEKVLSVRLRRLEEDWQSWVRTLRLPWGELGSPQGRLGVKVRNDRRGARVVGLVEGQAAEAAELIRAGDIIEEFNGRSIRNTASLMAAIRTAGAGRTVTIKLIRSGRHLTIRQTLGGDS